MHIEGLFDRETWHRVRAEVGYHVEDLDRPLGDAEDDGVYTDKIFLCRRPA